MRVAFRALAANKLRSLLTMLGIIIGVGSVITMIAMGTGAQRAVTDRIAALGTTLIMINASQARQGGVATSDIKPLTLADAAALEDQAKHLTEIQPQQDVRMQVQYRSTNISIQVTGSTPNFLKTRKFSMAAGRMFTEAEDRAARRVSFAQGTACFATPASMTPPSWKVPVPKPMAGTPRSPLHAIADYPLAGPANRFDYQSVDVVNGRLYLNHMNAGRTVVFDLNTSKVVGEISGLPRATGVWAVPEQQKVFVSAAGNHEVAIIDSKTLTVTARVGSIRFPDGIAYAPGANKVFVSDETGDADVVIDAHTNTKRSTISLGGEAGNTHYDSVSHCIIVAVQTRNELVAIDPVSERIVARYKVSGADHPHGFTLDEPGRLAFVTGEGNSRLQVIDLRTMKVIGTHAVGAEPDVLAWDPDWRRLYVASEGGVLSVFEADGSELHSLGEYRAPHAHTVAVDPRTHRVYLPLENVNGRPVLRVLSP